NGAWGVYPFLPSGNILISDINGGLYVLKDNTKSSVNGEIGFASNIIESEQGVMLNLAVQRLNAETNSTSTTVSYQVIAGSAKRGEDFVIDDGTLTWAANDNNDKVLNIDIASDLTGKELPESFFIRIYNPTNGATLAKDSYVTVKISGVVDNGAGSFVAENMVIAENQQPLVIDVNRIGSTLGEISYSYQLVSNEAELGSDFEENSGVITWQDGENATKQITIILINDDLEEQDETFSLVLSSLNESRLGAYSNVTITIADDDKNNAPTITLDENFQVNTSQTVSLIAEAADSENDAMTYVWQQTAGDSINLSNETTLIANFVAPATAGELTFEFTATDFRAANAEKSITITVVAPVTPPPVQNSGGGGSSGGSMNFYLLAFLFFGFLQKYAKTKQLTKHS
ncbi:MAG: sodium:calcium exchanger, partial [Colwellia sp.]|nr:sodium:calcium exchanger [Colwellia sp.]